MSNGVDQASFRDALSRWASGVTVVTCEGPAGRPVGFTASSFSSLSLDPPLVLVCLDKRSDSYEPFSQATHMAISVLAEGQADVALRMASKGPDKIDGLPVSRGPATGLALFDGAIARLECKMHERLEGGDHVILVGLVLTAEITDGEPLLHYRRRFGAFQPT